jgi:hypothetical protein
MHFGEDYLHLLLNPSELVKVDRTQVHSANAVMYLIKHLPTGLHDTIGLSTYLVELAARNWDD